MPPEGDENSSRTLQNPPTQITREAAFESFEEQLRLGARVVLRRQMNDGQRDPSPPAAEIGTPTANENLTAAEVDLTISQSSPPPPPPLPPSPFLSGQFEVMIIIYCKITIFTSRETIPTGNIGGTGGWS